MKLNNFRQMSRYDECDLILVKNFEVFGFAPDVATEKIKYLNENGETFGIYGKYVIDLNFLLSYQVPNTIEVITNKESRDVREIEIRGLKVILCKSRLPITSENEGAYTLMELFNSIDMRQYKEDSMVRESLSRYIKEKKINSGTIYSLASFFSARTMKNLGKQARILGY